MDGRVHEQVSSVLFFTVFFEGERHDLSKIGGFGRKMPPPPGKPVTFYECHPEDHAPAPSVRADFIYYIFNKYYAYDIYYIYSTYYILYILFRRYILHILHIFYILVILYIIYIYIYLYYIYHIYCILYIYILYIKLFYYIVYIIYINSF